MSRTVPVTYEVNRIIVKLKTMNGQLWETLPADIEITGNVSGSGSIDSSLSAMYQLLNRNRKQPFTALSFKITSNKIL